MHEAQRLIRNVVVVGGGTAGWMTAAALSKLLKNKIQVTVVESEEIGTVGVGEATIPMIQRFNQVLEIDENEFMRETQATFKLAIEFVNWGKVGERYMHGFGRIGQALGTVPFEHYWRKLNQHGKAGDLADYSITRAAAARGRFMRPVTDAGNSPLAEIAYAFHFDASLYARYLRKYAEARGVTRVEGRIVDARLSGLSGRVESVLLADGRAVAGDLFIDCSGFRGLLIEQVLHTGYEDWSQWLPCDRAIAVPCESSAQLLPYTRATAHAAGWQWRIPLQHRIGNGHVFCSRFMEEAEAESILLANLDGKPLAQPRTLKFTTGMRRQAWNRNVVSMGLASGFMEPLESTSIHLVQTAIARLIDFFPSAGFDQADIDEYNRLSRFEYERIRDFLILHYHVNQRDDSAFWRHCREMSIPDTLAAKIELYQRNGRIVREGAELFAEVGWLQVMHGQNLKAQGYHPLADLIDEAETEAYLQGVREVIANCVEVMPSHEEFIAKNCRAAA
ncbi:tryptophan halogenase family protein [Roseateles sp. NT4]|uniref:tryptophan halogenase family protein n=1 Tax=Roseateles sp. NT4 TaxID=3453715 RepID=UPI003EF0236E